MLDNGEIPPDVTVYEYDEAGIDPYQFLEITNEVNYETYK